MTMGWSAAYAVFVTAAPLTVALFAGLALLRAGRGGTSAAARLTPGRAAMVAAAAWLVFFGYATVSAIKYLVRPWLAQHITSYGPVLDNALRDYLPGTLAAVLLFMLVRIWTGTSRDRAGVGWPIAGVRPARQLVGWTLLGFLASTLFSAWVAWTQRGAPGPWDVTGLHGGEPWKAVDGVLSAVRAAVTEEVVVVALPVMLLRAAGVRIGPLVVVILLAARLSYHLYYGWGSLGVLLWGGLFLWIYVQRGTLWPLLAAHFLFDAVNSGLGQAGYDAAWQATRIALLVGAGGYVLLDSVRFLRRRRRRFIAWQQANQNLLASYAARCSHLASRPIHLEPRLRDTHVARAAQARDGRYVIRIGPGLDEFSDQTVEAILTREAERIAVGAVDLDARTPWARWSLRVVSIALLVAAVGSAVAGVSGRAWGSQLAVPLAAVAAAVALVGEAVERRRRQQLEDAARVRAAAIVGNAALDRIRVEKQRQADPLTAPLQQFAESRMVARTAAAILASSAAEG
jgi:hypothetical protein